VIYPVEDPSHIRYIRDEILETYFSDNLKARQMMLDGSYKRLEPESTQTAIISQEAFLERRPNS
jgi:polyphosphate kinase